MDRLTASKRYGYAVSKENISAALDRLGEYEDTGVSPEEFARLWDIFQDAFSVQEELVELRDDNARLRAENERLQRERDAAVANSQCGCGICLAHNGMVCPKMARTEARG